MNTDDVDVVVDAPATVDAVAVNTPVSIKKFGRGKTWRDDENIALTRAVGSVGYDSINGSDQKGAVYWEKVQKNFVARGGSAGRSMKALKNRWSTMQTAINLFIGYYSTATSIERSGSNDDDYLQFAHDLYVKEQNVSFEYEACWRALQVFGDKWKVEAMNSITLVSK